MTASPPGRISTYAHRPARPGRRRLVRSVAITAGLAMLGLGLVVGAPARSSSAGNVRRPAPELLLPDLADPYAVRAVATSRGRPLVVNLFASWCLPCARELPVLQAASVANPDVDFLGVDHQDGRRAGLEMLRASGVTYPAVHDPDGTTAAAYRARGLPTTIIVTGAGLVAAIHSGELTRSQLDALIQAVRRQ